MLVVYENVELTPSQEQTQIYTCIDSNYSYHITEGWMNSFWTWSKRRDWIEKAGKAQEPSRSCRSCLSQKSWWIPLFIFPSNPLGWVVALFRCFGLPANHCLHASNCIVQSLVPFNKALPKQEWQGITTSPFPPCQCLFSLASQYLMYLLGQWHPQTAQSIKPTQRSLLYRTTFVQSIKEIVLRRLESHGSFLGQQEFSGVKGAGEWHCLCLFHFPRVGRDSLRMFWLACKVTAVYSQTWFPGHLAIKQWE